MPEPTVKYLSVRTSPPIISSHAPLPNTKSFCTSTLQKVKSISNTVVNFLTVFAFLNGGVREIMPFVRYAAQFIDLEWKNIVAKVCATISVRGGKHIDDTI